MSQTSNPRIRFLAVGDMHVGDLPDERLTAIFEQASRHEGVDFMTSAGDLANNGLPEQHDLILPWSGSLPFPFLPVMGNHDTHTPDRGGWSVFVRKYELESANYARRFGALTCVFLSPDEDCDGLTCDMKDSLAVLSDILAEGDGPVVVFFHAPVHDTVGGAPGRKCFLSTEQFFFLPSSDEVRAVFAKSNRPAVWVSGHTHSPITSERLIHTEYPAGPNGAPLHHVNLGSPYYTGRDAGFGDTPLLYRFDVEWTDGLGGHIDVSLETIPAGEVVRTERLGF